MDRTETGNRQNAGKRAAMKPTLRQKKRRMGHPQFGLRKDADAERVGHPPLSAARCRGGEIDDEGSRLRGRVQEGTESTGSSVENAALVLQFHSAEVQFEATSPEKGDSGSQKLWVIEP